MTTKLKPERVIWWNDKFRFRYNRSFKPYGIGTVGQQQ